MGSKQFSIFSKLRTWAQTNGSYEEWRKWAKAKMMTNNVTPPREILVANNDKNDPVVQGDVN